MQILQAQPLFAPAVQWHLPIPLLQHQYLCYGPLAMVQDLQQYLR